VGDLEPHRLVEREELLEELWRDGHDAMYCKPGYFAAAESAVGR
jgi:hypothetical protein